jgi:hypothetical protein
MENSKKPANPNVLFPILNASSIRTLPVFSPNASLWINCIDIASLEPSKEEEMLALIR